MQNQQINEVKRVVLLVIGITSGCSTTGYETQPSEARDGFYGIGAGVYNNRIEEQESRLEEVRHLQREARQEQQRLAADKNIKQSKINELDKELFSLTQETHQLARQLADFKPDNTQTAEKQSLMTQQLKQINLNIEQLQRDLLINRAEIANHQQQIKQLDKDIQQLWSDFQRLP